MGRSSSDPVGRISAALFGTTRQAVLRLLLGHADQRFYQRQIIESAGLGSGTVQRELAHLAEAGIVTRTVEGRQAYYQANRDCPVFAELQSLMRKTFGVTGILRRALQPLAGRIRIAFIYGSVAEGTERSASDIDIMIVGDKLSLGSVADALAQAQEDLQREINPSIYPVDEFRRKLSEGHHFVSRVVKDGKKLFLIGDDGGLKKLAQERVAQRAQDQPRGNRRPVRRRR